jgi:hypothetical protein
MLNNHRNLGPVAATDGLWSSVVSLIGSHEMAYLEHCRKYSMQAAA